MAYIGVRIKPNTDNVIETKSMNTNIKIITMQSLLKERWHPTYTIFLHSLTINFFSHKKKKSSSIHTP